MPANSYQPISQLEIEEPESDTQERSPTARPAWLRGGTREKNWWLIGSVATSIVLLVIVLSLVWFLWGPGTASIHPALDCPQQAPYTKPWSSLNFDHPTRLARENLRNDTHYITSFAQAGFTNEFIAYISLIYLGLLTTRVPIIPPIIPAAHVSKTAGLLPFSSIFNLTNLRSALRTPILEWADVKTLSPNASVLDTISSTDPNVEHLGCWSTKQPLDPHPNNVPPSENVLRLDLSFTRIPTLAYYRPDNKNDNHATFYGLAASIMPGEHKHRNANTSWLPLMQKSRLGSELKPEDQLTCFDFLYYITSGTEEFEFEEKWSPVWFIVGRHLTFTKQVVDLGKGYLRRALEITEDEEIPPIITVHIRRGDFDLVCKEGDRPPCHLPLSDYKVAVDKMRGEILSLHGTNTSRVLVASDETDLAFYDEVRSYGWSYLNHTSELTLEKYGEWFPLIIDKATLSMGVGFVGTSKSTFSILNARRVEDWNGGLTRLLSYW